jgi:hypothetical protein
MYHAEEADHTLREHTDVLFSNILHLLDTAKPPIKQTVLIIVGSLGKYVSYHPI